MKRRRRSPRCVSPDTLRDDRKTRCVSLDNINDSKGLRHIISDDLWSTWSLPAETKTRGMSFWTTSAERGTVRGMSTWTSLAETGAE